MKQRIYAAGLAIMLASAGLAAAQERPKQPAAPKPQADGKAPRDLPPKKPLVPFTISKATTYITGPLRKDGYVNYVAALNQRFGAGVTPKNNAAVPFLQAIGPGDIDAKYRDEYYRMLGIRPLPEKGDYFVALDKYAQASKDAGTPASGKVEAIWQDIYSEQLTQAMKRPWSKKEHPDLAGWLAANEKPLALLVAASQRPRRYDPLFPENGCVIGALLPAIGQYREAARALIVRAMLRVGEGKVGQAWEDLLACHRLARLAGQGPTLVEALIAIDVDSLACAGDQGLLRHARLAPAQISRMRADLDKLPPLRNMNMADKINVTERFTYLDGAGMIAREGLSSLTSLSGSNKPKDLFETLTDSMVREAVDWDQVLRTGNTWYDRLADAFGKSTRAERQSALRKIEDELHKLTASAKDWKSLGLSMLGGRKAVSERFGQLLVSLLLPATVPCAISEDRSAVRFDLTRLAFALAAYHADRGTFPAKLADLTPKYVATLPKDLFNASELHYQQEAGGYLLYSVGPNGTDDGGKDRDDCKNGEDWDDIAVRISAATAQKP